MAKEITQIVFDFSAQAEAPKEFLSGQPLLPEVKLKSTRGRKKLTAPQLDGNVSVPEDEILFQKAYYGIAEVAQMFNITASQIRFWDKEFDILDPRKNRKGDRFFKPADVKNLQLIHDLIRRRKFTMEGAKEFIKKNKQLSSKQEVITSLQKIKGFLMELKANL